MKNKKKEKQEEDIKSPSSNASETNSLDKTVRKDEADKDQIQHHTETPLEPLKGFPGVTWP